MRLRVAIASVTVLLSTTFFFAAPIIPVETSHGSYSRHCHSTIWDNYTDWQSLGYHLFSLGYYRRVATAYNSCL